MMLRRTLPYLAALVVGVVTGVLGTFGHRSLVPVGLACALVACVGAAVWVRATFGPTPLMAYVVGWVVAVQALAAGGPGGDVQVVADTTGLVWAYGTVVLMVAVLWLPRSWFADVAPRRAARPGPEVTATTEGETLG